MASTYLTRTFGSAGNRQSWTWSGWIKKSKVYNSSDSGDREVFFGGYSANNDTDWLEFGTQGDILFATSSSTSTTSTQFLRDVNGWYHVLVNYNGSNLKFYINNELFKDSTDFSGNRGINVAGTHTIGALATNQSSRRFTGVMSHVHFIDGTIYTPSAFGSTDATTGEWKINTNPNVTYGTNGFFILKDGNSVTDQSPNTNNFTVAGGTLTKTEDSPSNVFCTLNPLDFGGTSTSNASLSNGNTTPVSGSAAWKHSHGTLGMATGKYYWEAKQIGTGSGSTGHIYGICDQQYNTDDDPNNGTPNAKFYGKQGSIRYNNDSGTASFFTPIASDGDIHMIAFDFSDTSNGKLWFGLNGTWQNSNGSANNVSYASTTLNPSYPDFTGITVSNKAGVYVPNFASYGSGSMYVNFGNGYFGTTAVSSAGTNASGIGIFEYDVPTGYTALSTKGLNL